MRKFASLRSRSTTLVLLAACITISGGCQGHLGNWCRNGFKVGPDYCKPAAPVACDWIDAYDERVRQELPDNPAWWTVFNDPILNGLIEDTYRQNLPLREAGMRVVEARLQRQIAAGNLFPQSQQGFGEYSRGEVSQNTFPTNNLVPLGLVPPNAVSNWATGIDASWELDVWGRFRRSIESADATLDASIEDYDAILVSLIGETATAYIDYRVAQARLAYAEENVRIQQGSLDISDVQFKKRCCNRARRDAGHFQSATDETAASHSKNPASPGKQYALHLDRNSSAGSCGPTGRPANPIHASRCRGGYPG